MRRNRIGMAALLFGVGCGGLFHAVVLQEMMAWHVIEEAGAFLMAAWLGMVAGLLLLWSAFRSPGRTPSGRAFAGYLLFGWGAFNLVEGALNHLLLQTHHIRDLPAHMAIYDWAFLVSGMFLLLVGFALQDSPDPVPLSDERRSGFDRRDLLTRA
jgi:uncharacterized membrane protein